jgi:DUF2934 family protein
MAKDTTTKATTKRTRRTPRVAAPRRRSAPKAASVTHEQIALRAYELHASGVDGDAMAHWLRAERELTAV